MAKGYIVGSAWVEYISDTTARVHVDGHFQFGYWYEWGVRVRLYANGVQVATNAGYTTGVNQATAYCSGYVDVPRIGRDDSVSWSAVYSSETVDGYGGLGESGSTGGWLTITKMPMYAPDAPTAGGISRVSDNNVSLWWGNNTSTTKPYSNVYVQRSVDGGSWATIATLGVVSSYADTTTSANHSYAYRIASGNGSGLSGWVYFGTVYMTPAAPASISVARSGETNVIINVENYANTATALVLERSTDGANWSVVKTISGVVRSTTDNPGGGTFYYRAKNTRDGLVSGYAYSGAVVTITAPAPPTLTGPNQSAFVNVAEGSVALTWLHNTIDGSAQSAAEIQLSTDGGSTWTTKTASTSQSLTVQLSEFAVNDTVTWRVRTKGAAAEFGGYSATRSFSVAQVPTFSIVSPVGTVNTLPLHVQIDYSDPSGTINSMAVQITGAGSYYSQTFQGTSGYISTSDFIPADGESYQIEISVTSTTGLGASAIGSFEAAYDKPYPAGMTVEVDKDSTFVSITATAPVDIDDEFDGNFLVLNGESSYIDGDTAVFDEAEFEGDTVTMNTVGYVIPAAVEIYRVVGDERVLVGRGGGITASAFDRYAPLNTDFYYESVSLSQIGAINTLIEPQRIDGDFIAIVHGDEMLPLMYNPTYRVDVTLPDKQRVHAWGRRYPLSFVGDSVDEAREVGGVVVGIESVRRLNEMVTDGGRGVLKDQFGDVVRADFDGIKADFQIGRPDAWLVTMTANRIDGEAL